MMARFKRPHGFPGLLVGALLASQAAAHTLDDYDLAPKAGVGRDAFVELPAATNANGDPWSTGSLLGIDREMPVPLFVDPPAVVHQDVDFASPAQADPLGRALRSVVNVTARRQPGSSVPRVTLPAEQLDQVSPILVEDIAAAVVRMEEGLAQVITEALDARVDGEGRVTFSLLGVQGFHVTAGDGEVSLGHGDTAVAFNQAAGAQLERRIAALDAAREAAQQAPRSTFNPVRELAELGSRMVQYPLFWVLVVLALIGKLALVIARSHGRRHSRRPSSGGEQPKVKRTRTRIRLKRVRTRIRLQQPS